MSITTVAFLIAFATGVLFALARHPIYGLMTYVGVFYLSPADRWWGGDLADFRWSFAAAGVTLLAMLIHSGKLGKRPFPDKPLLIGLGTFVAWLAIQSLWAMDAPMHSELLSMYVKFLIVIYMIWRCIDSEKHLKLFLWTHVLGCTYFGWIVYSNYSGGRFEGFGGPGLADANAGALALVTGVLSGGALFLRGTLREKVPLVMCLALVLNAVVATISRSGFLALSTGGLIFNLFVQGKHRKLVRIVSILGVVLLLMLTTPAYWARIASIKYAGQDLQETEGIDTGGGRKEIIEAQWRMFTDHPFGCGHRCTADLSRGYLDARFLDHLTGQRSSHNTIMTLLVEQGIPGGIFYVLMLGWLFSRTRGAWRECRQLDGFVGTILPAVVAVLGAITIGDLFVDYLKFEIRLWFVGLLVALVPLSQRLRQEANATPKAEPGLRQAPVAEPAGRAGAVRQVAITPTVHSRKTRPGWSNSVTTHSPEQ